MTPELTTEWLADWSFRCGQWAEKVDQYCKDVQELTDRLESQRIVEQQEEQLLLELSDSL
jgi:hypothetical protein